MPKRKSSDASSILPITSKNSDSSISISSNNASQPQDARKLFSKTLVWIIITLSIVPVYSILHFNAYFQHLQYKFSGRPERSFPPKMVDRNQCHNDCWDQGTAGVYNKTPGFFHVTVNVTPEAAAFFTIFFLLWSMLQVAFFRMWDLFQNKRLDWKIVLCILVNLPTLDYALGILATYLNDRDNRMIGSQMPYSISEVIVSGMLIWMLDRGLNIPWIAWVIIAIDGSSLVKSVLDQLVNEPFTNSYALIRTAAFVAPDVVHLIVIPLRMSPVERKNKSAWAIVGTVAVGWILWQFFMVGSD
eukprot:CAMPEP_0117436810 /NCGR_PEP_ID=MMETSP0759-20121206/1198_1 /TAXON_ID=63605 /ORGANISM="Percolomonas cosmopolitus, Strain WS" /LENGTH=300 /DNA_ID=CAMNT_0005228419 /DNA_START=12 /DNA_END=914 /DNA_ORIENTATION=-